LSEEATGVAEFVHLRLHSEYSLSDGLVRVKALAKSVAEMGMPAVAVTDRCNFFGLVKFHKAAVAAGLKPIFGADLVVLDGDAAYPLCLLVMNDAGYLNLTRLISRAWQEGQSHDGARVRRAWLQEHADGLLALSGGAAGDIGQALLNGRRDLARERLQAWMELFPDRFYLELHRCGREGDEDHVHAAVDLAAEAGCPVVATNDVRFLKASEFEAHEARVCIAEHRVLDDSRRVRRYTQQQYLRSAEEMAELFADIPEALANSVAIARRCSMQLGLGRVCLPEYPVPDGMSMDEFFRATAHEGLDARLSALAADSAERHRDLVQAYRERLDFEIDTILEMGFPGYFLIVMDFIRWAKDRGDSRRPGARLRRRLPGRLLAVDHGSRPAAVRAAVRALPEPGARIHAGFRRRLLHGATRRGDRLRGRALRARGGVADHHLRYPGREGGGARRRRGCRTSPTARGPPVEDDSLRGRHDPEKALAQESALREFPRRGRGRAGDLGYGAAARGPDAQRGQARRRRGDRTVPPHGFFSPVLRQRGRQPGHAVRQE
jgi:hypothetical protein